MQQIIENLKIYGMEESIRASKYPMAVDIDKTDGKMTETVLKLAKSERGSGHDQFLTGIIAQFDLTFSIKAWTEAERYHFFDFVSSQSTMHRITRLDPGKQCNAFVDERVIDILWEKINAYNASQSPESYLYVLYNVPVGFRLTARMTTNYRQLKTIYAQRKNHRLPEWREFCAEAREFPMGKEFIANE